MQGKRLTVIKATAPSSWASYLINGDASGIDDTERNACDAWIAREGMGMPVDCEDAGFIRIHDADLEAPFAADCQTYTFLVPKAPTHRERKAAHKQARLYAQTPFIQATEDRKAYMRALAASLANLHILLAYRDCWQYGRYVHGAVSGTRQAFIQACWEELQYAKRLRA